MHRDRNPLDVAWAAGLFEGEGTFGAYSRKTSEKTTLVMALGTTDADVLARFAKIVGCGQKIHKRPPGSRGHKPVEVWRISRVEDVREVIGLFLPFMGERRRERALEVLAACDNVQTANAVKTHCPEGHPLSGENLMEEPIRRTLASGEVREYTARRCRKCRLDKARKRMRDYQRRVRNSPSERWRIKE